MAGFRKVPVVSIASSLIVFLLLIFTIDFDETQPQNPGPSSAWSDGLIEEIETEYNNIFIAKKGDHIIMSFRRFGQGYTESIRNILNEDELPVPYTRIMIAGLLYTDKPERLLMIGLGGGTTTRYIQKYLPDLTINAIELDPGVVKAAKKYFNVNQTEKYRIVISDARVYLMRNEEEQDIIMVDAFRGGYIPFHLLTQEFYEVVKERLKKGGCMVLNLHSGNKLFDSSLATVKTVFKSVDTYQVSRNVILIAFDGAKPSIEELTQKADFLQRQHTLYHDIRKILLFKKDLASSRNAQLLTDDFAPVNLYESIEHQNERQW